MPSDVYIPPPFGTHILFLNPTPPHPPSRSPLSDYNYCSNQALLFTPLDTMSKHVRWSNDVPRTPSPALSTGSQHSSVGPYTPPTVQTTLPQVAGHYTPHQHAAYLTPYAPFIMSQPLPSSPAFSSTSSSSSGSGSPLGLAVNEILSAMLHKSSSTRPFEWNLLEDPVRALGGSSRQYLIPPAKLAEPATVPPVAELKIQCETLAWMIVIHPSQFYGNICVTVGDVIQQLYASLRLRVSSDELEAMYRTRPDLRDPVTRAYHMRCEMSANRAVEEKKGVRRVDCLMGTTRFAGFKVVRSKPESIELSLMLKLR